MQGECWVTTPGRPSGYAPSGKVRIQVKFSVYTSLQGRITSFLIGDILLIQQWLIYFRHTTAEAIFRLRIHFIICVLLCLSVIVTHGNKMFTCLKFEVFFFSPKLQFFNVDYSLWSWKPQHICKPAEIPNSCMPLWLLHWRYHVCYQLCCCKPLGSVTSGL